MPVIITENDISSWDDKTGVEYHYPAKYRNLIMPGVEAIYYKGTMKDKRFSDIRLSDKPHYFGKAKIGNIKEAQKKNQFIAEILDYQPFQSAVLSKMENKYFEEIPESKKTNYWRDGVRAISDSVFRNITSESSINDEVDSDFTSNFSEGKVRVTYSTIYERNPKLRKAALNIHGYDCKACGLNFEKRYGEYGKGFIHVHHIKPISKAGEGSVNPKTDLIPVCPNCHAMIHKPKDKVLSIPELIQILNQAQSKK